MITREEIRELAQFQMNGEPACALSFYFQPRTPQNKSHREESILVKDLVRNALREAEKNGKDGCARADLDRILDLAENLHGNQARAKAIFACGARNFWREFDLPPQFPATQLFVNRRFHLKPLARLAGRAASRLWWRWWIASGPGSSISGSMNLRNGKGFSARFPLGRPERWFRRLRWRTRRTPGQDEALASLQGGGRASAGSASRRKASTS